MKTSDKILIGLIVILFAVPLLFAYTIKSKLNKNEYTIEKSEQLKSSDYYSGPFAAAKVVKVIGPGGGHLRCNLKLSTAMKYEYNNYWKQKIDVFNTNDTLTIQYTRTGKELHDQAIEISLPPFSSLVVDGAIVTLDSLGTNAGLNVTLKNGGMVIDRTKARPEEDEVKVAPSNKKEQMAQLDVMVEGKSRKLHPTTVKDPKLSSGLDLRDTLIYRLLYCI